MKLTNKLNLPQSFVNYATKGSYEYTDHRYSVTELLLPTRVILLNRKYANDIEKDVSDTITALFGTAVHKVLEDNSEKAVLSEFPLAVDIEEAVLSGRIDFYDLSKRVVGDYKTCSVSKIVKQDFEDWKLQGLMYAYLIYKIHNIVPKELKFYALMKDWSKIKSATSANYPSSPIYVWTYKIEDSDYDYIEAWIKRKIKEIECYSTSSELPMCTEEDRWYTGTKYAVYKNAGDKRAAYVADTEEDAHNYITNKCNGAGEIQIRKGEYLRCKYYCDCCKFCEKGGEYDD